MKPRALIAALAVLLGLAGPVSAGPFEDAVAATQRGDFAAALRLWRSLAEQGTAEAQYNLGGMYASGQGVPQDDAEWVKWFRLAAEQGFVEAQFNLGFMYGMGRGVPQDHAEAVKWYRLAAEQGLAQAQYNLGGMYKNGQGVPKDYVHAHKWYNLAAANKTASFKDNRDLPALSRDFVVKLMTPAQIVEAQHLAREWKPKGKSQ